MLSKLKQNEFNSFSKIFKDKSQLGRTSSAQKARQVYVTMGGGELVNSLPKFTPPKKKYSDIGDVGLSKTEAGYHMCLSKFT